MSAPNNAGVVALPDAEAQCRQLADLIRPHLSLNPALVGIHSGGVWIAGRLRELLGLSEEIGMIVERFGDHHQMVVIREFQTVSIKQVLGKFG